MGMAENGTASVLRMEERDMNGEQEIAYITCVNNEEMYAACREALAAQALPEGMRASFVPIRGAASMCAGYQEAQEGGTNSIFFVEIPKFAREPKKKISEMTKMERWMTISPTNSTITKGRNLP